MKIYSAVRVLCFSFLSLFCAQVFANTDMTKKDVSNTVSDSVITTKVKSKLVMDHSLSALKVHVSTNSDGVVALSGTVDSDSDAAALIQMVQSTDGVTDVNVDKLTVKKSKQPLADTIITAKVKGVFIRENLLNQSNEKAHSDKVSIETKNAVVYLTGNVTTQKEADNAVAMAKLVKGVKSVESRLKVIK
jgi:hyperosmotically inducible protein